MNLSYKYSFFVDTIPFMQLLLPKVGRFKRKDNKL